MEPCRPASRAAVPRETSLSPAPPLLESLEGLLAEGLEELDLTSEVEPALVPALAALARMTADWSTRMNLTGHRSPEAVARRLILDALALGSVLPEAVTIADLGSGAGFPGLPLALMRSQAQVTLVEARERRHHFQRAAVRRIGAANVLPIRGRAEWIEATPHALVIAQAVAQPGRALTWMVRWAEPGGLLAIPGGARTSPVVAPAGVEPQDPLVYRVPLGGPQRSVWLGLRSRGGRSGRPGRRCVR